MRSETIIKLPWRGRACEMSNKTCINDIKNGNEPAEIVMNEEDMDVRVRDGI